MHRFNLTGIIIAFMLSALCAGGMLPTIVAPTSTPDLDATAYAIATEIGAGPVMQWKATVEAMSTKAAGLDNQTTYDGVWKGEGVTVDGADLAIQLEVSENALTGIVINYQGTGKIACKIQASAAAGVSNVSFLPAPITNDSISIPELGITGHFFPNRQAAGSISTSVTNQPQNECNLEIKSEWQAAQK
jgi:hypothetical protein